MNLLLNKKSVEPKQKWIKTSKYVFLLLFQHSSKKLRFLMLQSSLNFETILNDMLEKKVKTTNLLQTIKGMKCKILTKQQQRVDELCAAYL